MKNNTSAEKTRFESLKTQFRQAPLSVAQLDELTRLAKRYDKKMATYLETHRSELI